MQIHLFPLVCLMSIQILRHFLANSAFAKSKGTYCAITMGRKNIDSLSSYHRSIVIALPHLRHHTIATSHNRFIAPSPLHSGSVATSCHRHHTIALDSSSSHRRSFVIVLSRHPSIYMYMYPRWCDGELPGLIVDALMDRINYILISST